MVIFCPQTSWSMWRNWLGHCLVFQDALVWVQMSFLGTIFEYINQFTVMKFQLIAVEYTGLKFTKGLET